MTKDTEYWKGVLKEAREQHEALSIKRDALDAEREEVNLRIVQLEQLITHATPLTSTTPLEKINAFLIENATGLNLADACRKVLQKSNTHMTPIEIRDTLAASRYDLAQYSNALASIHGVLKRMVESGEVEPLSHEVRGTMYRWKSQGTRYIAQDAGTNAFSDLRRNIVPPVQDETLPAKPGAGADPKPRDQFGDMFRSKRGGLRGLREIAEEAAKKSKK